MKPIYEGKCCGSCYWYDYKQCLCKNPGSRNFNYFAICDTICDDWENNSALKLIKNVNNTDNVNHPKHYETGKYECFEVMREVFGDEYMKGFSIGNAFKYLYRHKRKNGKEDIDKAIWYLNKYKELHQNQEVSDHGKDK